MGRIVGCTEIRLSQMRTFPNVERPSDSELKYQGWEIQLVRV